MSNFLVVGNRFEEFFSLGWADCTIQPYAMDNGILVEITIGTEKVERLIQVDIVSECCSYDFLDGVALEIALD